MSYASWFGVPVVSVGDNKITTGVNVQTQFGLSSYTTYVDVVPQILLGFRSTTTLNTNNPSEMLTYEVPATGWYQTMFQGVASHAGGGSGADWSNLSQLDWYVTKNNGVLSNTAVIVQPKNICGDSVSEFISLSGSAILPADQGDVLQWVTDGNATPAITSNYFSGFYGITIQKIG